MKSTTARSNNLWFLVRVPLEEPVDRGVQATIKNEIEARLSKGDDQDQLNATVHRAFDPFVEGRKDGLIYRGSDFDERDIQSLGVLSFSCNVSGEPS